MSYLTIFLVTIDGLRIASLLKQEQKTCKIPLIAVTGLVEKKEKELIFAVGFDDHIGKPYYLENLQQVIVKYLVAEHSSV